MAKCEVFMTYCGTDFPKKPTKTTSTNSVTIKKLKGDPIDFTRIVKVYVKAYDGKGNLIGNSIHAHFAGKDSKEYKNPKQVKISAKNLTLGKGKSAKIKASVKMEAGKRKALPKSHAAKLRYRSDNPNVATVDKKGNVTGVNAGTCIVYVYAKNGLAKKVAITVN